MRIKPPKRLKRDKPDARAVSEAPNLTGSTNFMTNRRGDGHAFRLLHVLDDFNRGGLGVEVSFPCHQKPRDQYPRNSISELALGEKVVCIALICDRAR